MRPAKENAFDMSRMLGKLVHVEMVGGRKGRCQQHTEALRAACPL